MQACGVAATYRPEIFDVADITQAKGIILTPEGKRSTDERWRKETPYLVDLIGAKTSINKGSIVLDYGCGVGRMSKALIERYGCRVIGVDISHSMRALAMAYVSDPRFVVCHPEALEWIAPDLGFDLAISIWVLQHCQDVECDIDRIYRWARIGGEFFVVNDNNRLVPTDKGWLSDGKSVRDLLFARFKNAQNGDLDIENVGEAVASSSYWSVWRA